MVGLFSQLDALLGIPLQSALEELPIGDDLRQALLDGSGELGKVLGITVEYCEGGLSDDALLAPIDSKRLMELYLGAVPMAREYAQYSS